MMTLYSGTTDPFSQRCRIVLHEKGMDFQIIGNAICDFSASRSRLIESA